MKTHDIRNQRGIALPLALFTLMILMTMMLSFVSLGSMEPTIARNHDHRAAATFAADAGIETAYDTLSRSDNWSQSVANGLGAPCTGCPQFVLTAAIDPSGVVTVTSTGTAPNAPVTASVEAQFRNLLMQAPGAVNFTGKRASLSAGGHAFTVNGLNDLGGDPLCQKWGIATATVGEEAGVETALSDTQKLGITGRDGVGNATITKDSTLKSSDIAALLPVLKEKAIRLDPMNLTGVDWGAPGRDVLVYAKGPFPNGPMKLEAITGYGILIVEDGVLELTGNLSWNGAIIVSGHSVGVRYGGGGNRSITGTLIINELDNTFESDPNVDFDIEGNAKVQTSCEAVARVSKSFRVLTSTWRET